MKESDTIRILSHQPLLQRGWVFQERMLAPRVMHFLKDQIVWECFEMASLETSPSTRLMLRTNFGGIMNKSYITPNQDLPEHEMNQLTESVAWHATTDAYSKGYLTAPEDRLPAISAIARHICAQRKLTPQDYVAGHWRVDLPHSLLWSPVAGGLALVVAAGGIKQQHRWGHSPTTYTAPSWS